MWLRLGIASAAGLLLWQAGAFIYQAGADSVSVQLLQDDLQARAQLDSANRQFMLERATHANTVASLREELAQAHASAPSTPDCLRPARVVRALNAAACAAGSADRSCLSAAGPDPDQPGRGGDPGSDRAGVSGESQPARRLLSGGQP